jgi:hypothetical protein
MGAEQTVLAHCIAPGPRDPEKAINDLLTALDSRDVIRAVWELDPKFKPHDES